MGQRISSRSKKRDYPSFTKEEASYIVERFEETNCQIPAIFFSCLTYDWRTHSSLLGKVFSEETGYKVLRGYGQWKVISEFLKETKLEVVRAVLLVCEERKQMIVAFRGTSTAFDTKELRTVSLNDWIHGSFHAHHSPWRRGLSEKYGTVHHGFLRHYQSIGMDLIVRLRMSCTEGYTVVFTGHSQGASLAAMAALECAELCPKCSTRSRIFLITFGAPKVGNHHFVRHFRDLIPQSHVTHYITCYPSLVPVRDLVTTVPPNFMKFRNVDGRIFYVLASKKHLGIPTFDPTCSVVADNVPSSGTFIQRVPVWLHFREIYMFGILEKALSDRPFTAKYERYKMDCAEHHAQVEHHCEDAMRCTKNALHHHQQLTEQQNQQQHVNLDQMLQYPHNNNHDEMISVEDEKVQMETYTSVA